MHGRRLPQRANRIERPLSRAPGPLVSRARDTGDRRLLEVLGALGTTLELVQALKRHAPPDAVSPATSVGIAPAGGGV